MKVLTLFPPNYAEINRAFKIRGKHVIFAYGDIIYNPSRIVIPPELLAHEAVHGARQNGNPAAWWDRYITDSHFRLEEEIPAHQAEYQVSRQLKAIAERLSGPLYGNLISFDKAVSMLASNAGD